MYTLPHQQTEQMEQQETLDQEAQTQDTRSLEQARQAIERAASSPFSPPSVLTALQSSQPQERTQALQVTQGLLTTLQMAMLQKQGVDDMITLLLKETREARHRRQVRWVKAGLFVLVVVWLLWATHLRLLGNFWWLFSWGGGAWAVDQTLNRRRATVSALGQAGDPRAVGALAVAVRDGEKAVQQAANEALFALLPRVQANHAAYITPDQMNALLELAFRSNIYMQLAVLKALEQIGDQRAIPVVQNLAMSPDSAVRERAKQCLPFLTERARRAEQSATLLRGASVPSLTAGGRELLRPATQAEDATPADQLLRPTSH